jgi:adenylate cyclase
MSASRQLSAIMFTDIVSYTTLMGEDEQKAFKLLYKNRQIQQPVIKKFGGTLIKELGDGILAILKLLQMRCYVLMLFNKLASQCQGYNCV